MRNDLLPEEGWQVDLAHLEAQIDAGTHYGSNESDVYQKDKHFFDEEETYANGWSWYTARDSTCSTDVDDGTVGADFTETYLESGTMTARKMMKLKSHAGRTGCSSSRSRAA